jgi:hypothetical protein
MSLLINKYKHIKLKILVLLFCKKKLRKIEKRKGV